MTACEDSWSCAYATAFVILISFVITPFNIYATRNMFKYRDYPGVNARYPQIVITSAIFATIHSFICEQYFFLSSGVNLPILNGARTKWIANILFPPILLLNVNIIVIRMYFMHYGISYAVKQSTYDWQSLLCDTVSHTDFYSRNYMTYGNWKYMYKYFIGSMTLGCLIEMACTICEHPQLFGYSHSISQLVYILCLFISIVFLVVLYLKTPKFEDAYFVKKEMKYLVNLGALGLALYVVMMLLNSDEYPIFEQVQTSAITMVNLGIVIISEYIMPKKLIRGDSNIFHSNNIFHGHKRQSQLPKTATWRHLFAVLLASPKGIPYYVKHIRSEFCVENLMCLIELIQWIYQATDKDFNQFDISPFHDTIRFELSSAIPISSANAPNDNGSWDWEHSILQIYEKYIHSSAQYQVNLSYELQSTFANLIHLLQIKHSVADGTYTFHNKKKESSSRKTDKSTTPAPLAQQMIINAPNSPDTYSEPPPNRYNNVNPDPQVQVTASAMVQTTKQKKEKHPLIPAVRTTNSCKSLMLDDEYHSLHEHQAVGQENETLNLFPYASAPCLAKSNDQIRDVLDKGEGIMISGMNCVVRVCEDFNHDKNELIVLDDVNFDEVSTLRSTMRSTVRSTVQSLLAPEFDHGMKKEQSSIATGPKLKPTLADSVKSSLKRFGLFGHSTSTQTAKSSHSTLGDAYLMELKSIERAKHLSVFEFVSIACHTLHAVLLLNYQSICRFKQSEEYRKLNEAVNLEQLFEKYKHEQEGHDMLI
eukprot:64229_1